MRDSREWRLLSRASGLRLCVGFAVMPALDFAIVYYASPALGLPDVGRGTDGGRDLATVVGILSLIVTVSAAVPTVSWLMRGGRLSLKRLLIAGLVLGNAPFGAYLAFLAPIAIIRLVDGTLSQHLIPLAGLLTGFMRGIYAGSFVGIASAFVFWLIAVSAWGKGEIIRR